MMLFLPPVANSLFPLLYSNVIIIEAGLFNVQVVQKISSTSSHVLFDLATKAELAFLSLKTLCLPL